MTQRDEHEPYYVLYDGDFGITGLAGGSADFERDEQLGVDARSVLESDLSEDELRTLWPAGTGGTVRSWLRAWSDAYPAQSPGRRPFPAHLRDAVLVEIEAVEAELARAVPSEDVVPALRRIVVEVGADLGFRMLLRLLKTHSVRVDKARYDRFIELAEPFGYHCAIVRDGLAVDWPPLDPNRRDSTWDFGLSALAAWFAGEWYDHTAEEVVRMVAVGDDILQAPGSAAAELLDDALRLHASPLSDDTVDTLWLAASDGTFGMGPDGPDTRRRLEWIAGICRERLRETAPEHLAGIASDHLPGPAPVRRDPADDLLAELRDLAPEFAARTVQPHGQPVPGAAVARALEQVVAEVDPDLGFRLFLRILIVLDLPLGPDRYARYQAFGERFGYGEFHVSNVQGLVQDDL